MIPVTVKTPLSDFLWIEKLLLTGTLYILPAQWQLMFIMVTLKFRKILNYLTQDSKIKLYSVEFFLWHEYSLIFTSVAEESRYKSVTIFHGGTNLKYCILSWPWKCFFQYFGSRLCVYLKRRGRETDALFSFLVPFPNGHRTRHGPDRKKAGTRNSM